MRSLEELSVAESQLSGTDLKSSANGADDPLRGRDRRLYNDVQKFSRSSMKNFLNRNLIGDDSAFRTSLEREE